MRHCVRDVSQKHISSIQKSLDPVKGFRYVLCMPRPTSTRRTPRDAAKNGVPKASKAKARNPAPRPASRPLGAVTLQSAQANLDRLSAEFAGALASIGAGGLGPRALSRTLGSDVVLCHRLLAGIRSRGTVADRIAKWPGEAGMRMLVQRIGEVSKDKARTRSLAAAVDEFANAVSQSGGSRTRLVRRIRSLQGPRAGGAPAVESAPKSARRSLNRAAGEILGYDVALITHISVVRPIPDQPAMIEGCSALGLIGIESQGSSICVASHNVQMRDSASAVATQARWRPLGRPVNERDGLLEEFCSSHSVLVESNNADGFIRQMVDLDLLSAMGSADVVLARAWRPDVNPQHTNDPIWSKVLRMRHPAKRMLFDGYVHRSMLDGRPPEAGAYFWHPSLKADPRSQWHDRFPVACPVQVLPSAPVPASSESWEKQAELTDRIFSLVGWDRSEFVGFRCDDPAPVWSAAYYMTFNLRKPPEDSATLP